MQSDITMKMGISSISWQIGSLAKSRLMNSIDGFSAFSNIWAETKNDGDTLKIRKKGVN